MSTHQVEVVSVQLESHPNADSLSVVRIRGYSVCVRTADWQNGALGAYVPPDSVVDSTRPEFAFLAGHERVRVKRLRGVLSQGLLVPAPPGAVLGDDVMEALGVQHYEPPVPLDAGGETEIPPDRYAPSYDIESWYRYGTAFRIGEPVVATEKIHGANGRFCFHDGRLWCGSKTEWKRESANNLWWRALAQNDWLRFFCETHPELVVYGEVYGKVQELKYGVPPGQYRVAIYDCLRAGEWLPWDELETFDLHLVPVIYRGPYDETALRTLSDGPSLIPGADHLREGIVVRPVVERTDIQVGRVHLKLVSNAYLERS